MICLGADIGYGNCKWALQGSSGDGQATAREGIMPVGAAPITSLLRAADTGQPMLAGGHEVLIDGERWVAGVPSNAIQRHNRVLDRDYPASKQYLALFHAILLCADSPTIDHLVTGLPVDQAQDRLLKETLRRRLLGTHVPSIGREVTVRNVTVVSQPAGAYVEAVRMSKAVDPRRKGISTTSLCLVMDPGFFSVDWILMRGSGTIERSSGSCALGAKEIYSAAAAELSKVSGHRVGADRVEASIRAGDTTIALGNHEYQVRSMVHAAAKSVTADAMGRIRGSIDTEDESVDTVILTGGGASFFRSAVELAFQKSRVVVPEEPVMMNARGFALLALNLAVGSARVRAA